VESAPKGSFVVAKAELEQALTQVPAELRGAHGDPMLGEDVLEPCDHSAAFRRVEAVKDPSTHGLVAIGRAVVLEGETACGHAVESGGGASPLTGLRRLLTVDIGDARELTSGRPVLLTSYGRGVAVVQALSDA
jgi:hypothetical protein